MGPPTLSNAGNNFDPNSGVPTPGVGPKNDAVALKPYLIAMGYNTGLNDGEEIDSFVPFEPSLFQARMRDGDTAFRAGRYGDAEGHYELALALARHSPEVHLSLMQCNVALGRYNTAAFHLQKALGYYPELPLARIALRKFYGDQRGDFAQDLENLRREVDGNAEPQVGLVLSFFYYFDGSDREAIQALQRADKLAAESKDHDTAAAADIFWNGMVAAGRGAGTIENASMPASRPTQPGDAATGPAGSAEIKLSPRLIIEPAATSQP